MRVGLTYDLRDDYLAAGYGEEETAEFDPPGTIDAIDDALRALGHATERIGNLRQLVDRLAAGERWDLVFNTAEGLAGFGREAQVPALLEAYDVACTFSDPLVSALTLHKGMAKRVLRDLGIPTPEFRMVESIDDARRVDLPWPVFAKPVAEGTAKGIDGGSRIASREALVRRCRELLAAYRQPVLVEPFLPGREFTVGLLGTGEEAEAVGTLEIGLLEGADLHAYTYLNKERCEDRCRFELAGRADAEPLEALALRAWRGIGGRDAGRIDLRLDAAGRPQVLEINVLPGLHPTHSDLPMICTAVGISHAELIRRIVESAARRQTPAVSARRRRASAHRGDPPSPPPPQP
jgi:D-alanine-D-alanine ligase